MGPWQIAQHSSLKSQSSSEGLDQGRKVGITLARHDRRTGPVVGFCERVAARRGIRDPGKIGTVDTGEDTLRAERASTTWSSVDFSAFRAEQRSRVQRGIDRGLVRRLEALLYSNGMGPRDRLTL